MLRQPVESSAGKEEAEMEIHDLLADVANILEDTDEKLTPAQVSKMQKALEQARMLMKNLGRPRAKAGAKAKAEPKVPPKVEAKAGEKRKRGRQLLFANL